jgi:hypothetical protein
VLITRPARTLDCTFMGCSFESLRSVFMAPSNGQPPGSAGFQPAPDAGETPALPGTRGVCTKQAPSYGVKITPLQRELPPPPVFGTLAIRPARTLDCTFMGCSFELLRSVFMAP